MTFLKCRSNSITSLLQLLLSFPIMCNIRPNPFIACSPLSSLMSFHWNALCTLLVTSRRAFFISWMDCFPCHIAFQDDSLPAWNSSCTSTLVYVGSTYGSQLNHYSEKPSLTRSFWGGKRPLEKSSKSLPVIYHWIRLHESRSSVSSLRILFPETDSMPPSS